MVALSCHTESLSQIATIHTCGLVARIQIILVEAIHTCGFLAVHTESLSHIVIETIHWLTLSSIQTPSWWMVANNLWSKTRVKSTDSDIFSRCLRHHNHYHISILPSAPPSLIISYSLYGRETILNYEWLSKMSDESTISLCCRTISHILFSLLQDDASSSGTDMSICRSEALFSSYKVFIMMLWWWHLSL